MHTSRINFVFDTHRCKSQQQFRLQFQRGLQRYLTGHHSVAEGFGIVWEKTLEQVPLPDDEQGAVYRQLLAWARSADLFTGPREHELLHCWRETVHEF